MVSEPSPRRHRLANPRRLLPPAPLPLAALLLTLAGSAATASPPSSAATILTTVDALSSTGEYNSLVLDSRGFPVISYRDQANGDLRLAICSDAACASATFKIVDPAFNVGRDTSLALNSNGFAVIAYVAFGDGLRLAVCNDAACSNPALSTVDNPASGGVSIHASLALQSNGFPTISYYDCCSTNNGLRVAICSDTTCSSPSLVTLDSGSADGESNSLTLNSSNAPVVSYTGGNGTSVKIAVCGDATCSTPFTNTVDAAGQFGTAVAIHGGVTYIAYLGAGAGPLRLATCADALCSSPTLTTVAPGVDAGWLSSLVVDAQGLPTISYYDQGASTLNVAACTDPTCSAPTLTTIEKGLGNAAFNSLALDHRSRPVITYNGAGALQLAICNACTPASIETVDAVGNVGQFSDVALRSNGFPVISYYDANNVALKLALCNDPTCSTADTFPIDSAAAFYTSIALSAQGAPIVSYWNANTFDLELAICNDPSCTSPTLRTVDDTSASVGTYSSIALQSNGAPVISYYDEATFDLKLAVCPDALCNGPSRVVVDGTSTSVGRHTSVALRSNGRAVISYYDQTNSDLKIALCNDVPCTTATLRTVDPDVGFDGVMGSSVALSSTDVPVIGYYDAADDNLMLAVCDSATCDFPTLTIVDSAGDVGRFATLALTSDDFPILSYYDSSNTSLKVAVCNDVDCSTPSITTVDNQGSVGEYAAMTLNRLGFPVVSYFAGTGAADLRLANLEPPAIFTDDFESGTPLAWSAAVP